MGSENSEEGEDESVEMLSIQILLVDSLNEKIVVNASKLLIVYEY